MFANIDMYDTGDFKRYRIRSKGNQANKWWVEQMAQRGREGTKIEAEYSQRMAYLWNFD